MSSRARSLPSTVDSRRTWSRSKHGRAATNGRSNLMTRCPNTSDSTYSGDLTEHASFHGTLLDSTLSFATFRAGVWPQGNLPMTLFPAVNEGNYFSQQTRTSSRLEWRETW